jgi:hypothetical protein
MRYTLVVHQTGMFNLIEAWRAGKRELQYYHATVADIPFSVNDDNSGVCKSINDTV